MRLHHEVALVAVRLSAVLCRDQALSMPIPALLIVSVAAVAVTSLQSGSLPRTEPDQSAALQACDASSAACCTRANSTRSLRVGRKSFHFQSMAVQLLRMIGPDSDRLPRLRRHQGVMEFLEYHQ
jgi:hypothetical protein